MTNTLEFMLQTHLPNHYRIRFVSAALLLLALTLGTAPARAQVTVVDNVTAAQMVEKLVGTGITYLNPVLTCPQGGSGSFTAVNSNLNIDSGIILTSGLANTNGATFVTGANGDASLFAATGHQAPGDPQLNAIVGPTLQSPPFPPNDTTNDACKLEFDFIPNGDSLLFNYVLGSEEYQGFSCSNFNDVFAFFLSGPLYPTPVNIALIPGTNIPVAINSTTDPAVTFPFSTASCNAMGPGSPFAQYYVDNQNGTTITYDGFTSVFTARAQVIPCSTYHIKLVIADVIDDILDSGVFIEANSFRSNDITLSLNAVLNGKYDYLIEGCTEGTVTATRPQAVNYPQTVHFSYTGSATRNADYFNAPDSLTIPAGATTASFTIQPVVQDNLPENIENIVINVLNRCNNQVTDSFIIPIHDFLPFQLLSDDTAICAGAQVRLEVSGDPDFTWSWFGTPQDNTIQQPNNQLTYAFPEVTTQYTVIATYLNCRTDSGSFQARIEPGPVVDILQEDVSICQGQSFRMPVSVTPQFDQYTYSWEPQLYLDDYTIKEPEFFNDVVGDYPYILNVRTPLGCRGSDDVVIHVRPATKIVIDSPQHTILYGSTVQLEARGAQFYTWSPPGTLTNPNVRNPIAKPGEDTRYTVIGMNEFGCRDSGVVDVTIDYLMTQIIPNAFSPNGDGRNDKFRIGNLRYQRLIEFRVFNRWGREVFSTTDPAQGWDGRYNGEPQELGVYHYLIRINLPNGELKTFKGDVTLVR